MDIKAPILLNLTDGEGCTIEGDIPLLQDVLLETRRRLDANTSIIADILNLSNGADAPHVSRDEMAADLIAEARCPLDVDGTAGR